MSTSARYQISHRTRYRYPDPVAICQNQLRMMPRDFSSMKCHQVKCNFEPECIIEPEPDVVDQHDDYFGNRIYSFAIESLHRELVVTVNSDLTVHTMDLPNVGDSPSWQQIVRQVEQRTEPQWFAVQEFCYDSPRVTRDQVFADYASVSFSADRPIVEAALDLTRRIHQDFKYDTLATHVNTSPQDSFRLKAGVCQDFAHVEIGCLRSLGIPARYVSGYLRTIPPPGKTKMIGADESHAWISVYGGNEVGWVDLDPTNACVANINHIPICIGRDYSEVSPMRGVVLGGGKTELSVSVDVKVVDPPVA